MMVNVEGTKQTKGKHVSKEARAWLKEDKRRHLARRRTALARMTSIAERVGILAGVTDVEEMLLIRTDPTGSKPPNTGRQKAVWHVA